MTELENVKNESANDFERLIKAITEYGEGKYDCIDPSEFDDPSVAEKFNEMVEKSAKRANRMLARINDAQSRIGDTSCLKQMFEQITAQQDALNMLQKNRAEIIPDERPLGDMDREFLALSQQIGNALDPCIAEMEESLNLLESMNIPDEDKWSVAEDEDEYRELRKLKENMTRSLERLSGISRRVDSMSHDASTLFRIIEKKGTLSKGFLDGVDALTVSYKNLSADCLDTGRHLYRISRDIDNARNDMFRNFSRPTLHDRLHVYEVDHITLVWRLYNNIVEFESLKLTQLNNPNTCKLGKWIIEMENTELATNENFINVKEKHELLHVRAVECFEAKQNYDTVLAMDKFAEAMDALKEFQDAIEKLHAYLRSVGDYNETDVWKFQG